MNKVILIGRTTADVELKTLSNENVVTNFCLAVDRDVSKDGEKETDGRSSTESIPKNTGAESAPLPDGYDEIGDEEDLPF